MTGRFILKKYHLPKRIILAKRTQVVKALIYLKTTEIYLINKPVKQAPNNTKKRR
jgi:hypothetical protein